MLEHRSFSNDRCQLHSLAGFPHGHSSAPRQMGIRVKTCYILDYINSASCLLTWVNWSRHISDALVTSAHNGRNGFLTGLVARWQSNMYLKLAKTKPFTFECLTVKNLLQLVGLTLVGLFIVVNQENQPDYERYSVSHRPIHEGSFQGLLCIFEKGCISSLCATCGELWVHSALDSQSWHVITEENRGRLPKPTLHLKKFVQSVLGTP